MKQFKYAFALLAVALAITSCEKDANNTIDQVLAEVGTGAILRTLSVNNATLNSSEPTSEFSVTVEEQDEEEGDLLQSVDVFVSMQDMTPDNGETVVNDILVKSYAASEFTDGPFGLPRATISATFGESAAAMGLTSDDYAPGDVFVYELRLNLTNGATYGAASAGGIITGGFFASPFAYSALILCSPQPGEYRVEMHDSYGDGWQTDGGNGGSGITVDVDGVIQEVGMCSPYEASDYDCTPWPDGTSDPTSEYTDATAYVTIPEGASSAIWFFPGDTYGEISFEVYGPGDEELFVGLQGETGPGLLPITLCAE
ncbi:MAG: hypothetical protein ABJM06_00535 [Gilvibacter sp.]